MNNNYEMKSFRIILLISISVAWATIAITQDIHFSQYDRAPLHLNPALTGQFDGKVRALANYRNQWSQVLKGDAYNTYAFSGDTQFKTGKNDAIGLGISGARDVAGELSFGTTQVNLNLAYHKRLWGKEGKDHRISLGLNYGIAKRRVDLTGARWPSQHDGNGGWNGTTVEPPTSFNSDFNYGDLGMGIVWRSTFLDNQNFQVGFAIQHLNRPNVSFYGNDIEEELSRRYTAHLTGEIAIGRSFALLPAAYYQKQGVHAQLQSGSALRKYFRPESFVQSVQLGWFSRVGNKVDGGVHVDAAIAVLQMNLKRLSIGLSQDLTVSELREAGSFNGAWEINLGYIFGKKKDVVMEDVEAI